MIAPRAGTLAIGGAVVASGCAQLVGLADTSGTPGPTLQVQRVSVGATVARRELDLMLAPPTFLVPDPVDPTGTRIVSARHVGASWTADVAGSPAAVFYGPDLPANYFHQLALGSHDTRVSFVAFEHADPAPAPAAQLATTVTLPAPIAAGQTFAIQAIGAWTTRTLGASEAMPGMSTIAASIPYASFAAMTSSPPARIAAADVVLVLRYTGTDLSGVLQVPGFEQSDTSDPIAGALTALVDDRTLAMPIAPAALASRFAAVQPAVTSFAASWQLVAAPGADAGTFAGVTLQSGAVAMTDTTITTGYAMPFDALGWKPVLALFAGASRSVSVGGATTRLGASLQTDVDPARPGALDVPAGLPRRIAIAGRELVADDTPVTIDPSRSFDVTFEHDGTTAQTWFQISIDELAVAGTAVTRTHVAELRATAPTFSVPPWYLMPGKTYTITAVCASGGYADASRGDMQTVTLPIAIGATDSATFTVVGP